MRVLSFLILLAAVTGCASPRYNYSSTTEAISRPEIGSVNTARLGDELLVQGTATLLDGIIVPPNTRVAGYMLQGGFYAQVGQDDRFTYHSFVLGAQSGAAASMMNTGTLTSNPLLDPPQSIRAARDGSELCVITIFNLAGCRERPFERHQRPFVSADHFQQTLIYNGRVGDRIMFAYRETSGNYARPAFNNEVEYDLATSNVVGYRGAELEVIEATNTEITYRVISNFNAPSR